MPRRSSWYLILGLVTFGVACGHAADGPKQPRELGTIAWERDYEMGVERAKKEGKPVLLLFQEVPG